MNCYEILMIDPVSQSKVNLKNESYFYFYNN